MHFEGDAFISYAHLDNVELVEGRKGWVANFHRALEVRVGQLLGKAPQIWRDPKLHGNDLFSEMLMDRLRHVAVLVTVVSPRYLKSEWTLREFREFWSAAETQGGIRVVDKSRVFKVLKTPVPLERMPPELQALLGYEFFKIDPGTGKIRELDEVFGPEAQREFWIRLDDLAHDICNLIETLEHPEQRPVGGVHPITATQDVIFLAETTSDLTEQREALKRDLQQHGHVVLPNRMIPATAPEAAAVIRQDLANSRMSIHLVGKDYSPGPDGLLESLIEIQHELATERSRTGGFSRLLWIPKGLEIEDDRQRKVIERLRLDQRIGDGADLLETFFEDLRTVVESWLKREPGPPEASAPPPTVDTLPRLYLVADQRDTTRLAPWADALFEQGVEVICPVFEGDEAEIREFHEDNLNTSDGMLIFYGAGNELWLRRKLRELQKCAGYGRTRPRPLVGICLVAPRTAEKERFRTHEAMVIPQWDGFSPAPLQPFIKRLKAGNPA